MSKRKKTTAKTNPVKLERPPILSGREAIAALTEKKVGNAETKPTPEAPDKQPAPQAEKKMSALDAAAQVLTAAETPLNTKMIVERMVAKGLWTTSGKTPSATLFASLIREIAAKGDQSRFKKTDRGLFTLRKN